MVRDRRVTVFAYAIPLILYLGTLISGWLNEYDFTSISQVQAWQVLCTIALFVVYPIGMIVAKRQYGPTEYWTYRGTFRLSVLLTLFSYLAVLITQRVWNYYF